MARESDLQSAVSLFGFGKRRVSFPGPGPDATKSGMPPSWVVAGNGIVYIAGDLNNRIYRLKAATGAVTLLAGAEEFGNSGDNGAQRVWGDTTER